MSDSRHPSESFLSIAGELNNTANLFHACGELDRAVDTYRAAVRAMMESLDLESQDDGSATSRERRQWWQNEILRRRSDARRLFASRTDNDHSDIGTSVFPLQLTLFQNVDNAPFFSALRIDETNNHSRDVYDRNSMVILYNLGLLLIHMQGEDEAVELFQMALSLMPTEINFRSNVAVSCVSMLHLLGLHNIKMHQEDQAINLLGDALRLGNTTLGKHLIVANILDTLGHLLRSRGEDSAAEAALDSASRMIEQLRNEEGSTAADVNVNSGNCPPPAA